MIRSIKQTLSASAVIIVALVSFAHAQTAVIRDGFERNFDGWTNHGDYAALTAIHGEGYNSSRGMKVTGRKSPDDGAASLKGFYIEDGANYNYSVYVRHTGSSAETFNLAVQYVTQDGKTHESKVIATAVAQPNQWTQLNASFATPRGSVSPTFFITTNSANDFYFDEFVATGRGAGLAKAAAPMQGDGLKDRFASHFRVGNILNGGTVNNAAIRNLILREYNSITAENEHKPNATMTRTNSTNTNIRASINTGAAAMMNFAAQNNIPMRGHVLFWHGQSPDWFFLRDLDNGNYRNRPNNEVPWATPAVMNQRMESYVQNLFALYESQYPDLWFYAYDVVNEFVRVDNGVAGPRRPGFDGEGAGGAGAAPGNSPWQAIYGNTNTEWVRRAFELARRYAPANTKLFYNDYNEWDPPKMNYITNTFLLPYLQAGILDGMGMQGHISANPNDGWSGETRFFNAMEHYAAIAPGFEVQITELDVSTQNGQFTSQQPGRYQRIFERAISINAKGVGRFTAICIWAPNDANTWIGSQNAPALHDANNNPKAAYTAVAGIVPEAQWGDGNNPTFPGAGGGSGGGIIEPDPVTGYYFHHTYEDGTAQGWAGRGGTAANTNTQAAGGTRSVFVSGRTASWHGVQYELNARAFVPGGEYSFSVLAKYVEGPETDQIKFTLSYDLDGDAVFAQVALVEARRDHWVMLENANMPIPVGASNLLLYVEMPNSETGAFYIDDAMGGRAGTAAPGRGGVTPIPVEPDVNGYFFHHTFEDGTVQEWGPRFGAGTVTNVGVQSANGERSLYMSGRSANFQGAAFTLPANAFRPGHAYSFSVLAMFTSEDAGNPATDAFKFTLQYTLGEETVYDQIALVENASRNTWVLLENANFPIPAGASNLILYVEMPDNETASFYIDDAMGGIAGAEAPGKDADGKTTSVRVSSGNKSARPLVAVRGRMLNVSSPNNSELTIRMIDTRGRVRARFNAASGSGNFALTKIPAGRYFVDVRGAGVRQMLPVIVK